MKKLMTAAIAVALLAGSSLAASALTAAGTVTGIDTTAGSVTLDNGKVYSVSASAVSMVMVGDLVTVTYTADASGKLNASDVEEAFPVYH